MKQTIILAILDGWGIGSQDETNPIYVARPQTIDMIERTFPAGALQASGIAAGLPWEEEGNSEVGHLTMGAGKIIYQHFPRISLSIDSGEFFGNEALRGAFAHARANASAVHLAGLLTAGNVHASLPHLFALIDMAAKEKAEHLYLHLIADGRDSPPESAGNLLARVAEKLKTAGIGSVVDVVGRYFAMNRDEHWERTERAYRLWTADALPRQNFEDSAKRVYARGANDEFIDPTVVGDANPIKDNDAVIFFNFREDSMRQITRPFLDPSFSGFVAEPRLKNLYVATMTEYHERYPAHVAFPNDTVNACLGKALADGGKTQLRIAETQKYAHVTFFFNGLKEKPFENEFRVLIPSLDLPHPEARPEMRAEDITERALVALHENTFDCIIMNYANADIIAHTGNYQATLEAVTVLDRELSKLVREALAGNHILIVTSDHGNAEVLIDQKTGNPETRHNVSPVPFYLIGNAFRRNAPLPRAPRLKPIGLLSDVAPTVLALMGLPKPDEMTGQSLLDQLGRGVY